VARCQGGVLPGSQTPRRPRLPRRLLPSRNCSSPRMHRQRQRRTAVPSRRQLRETVSLRRQHHQQQLNRRRRLLRLQSLLQMRRLQDRQRSKPQMQRQMLHRAGSRRATHPGDSQPTVPLRRRRHSRRRQDEIEDSLCSLMLNLAAADRSSSVTSDQKHSATAVVLAVCLLTPNYHVEGVYITGFALMSVSSGIIDLPRAQFWYELGGR
jgi:hypothetical protein